MSEVLRHGMRNGGARDLTTDILETVSEPSLMAIIPKLQTYFCLVHRDGLKDLYCNPDTLLGHVDFPTLSESAVQRAPCDHQGCRSTDVHTSTYMSPLNWMAFIKQLQAGLCQPAEKGRVPQR
ncbi:unnamed protein product [Pleuronectes platessa]|uniref:Uncharacterized protein n=1 Tax=Pleuronectes platessa TaxID=8262 RepID=A0A9N7VFM7_PLEPL|nr:unnamed protein product [Pleuronectes platessa]